MYLALDIGGTNLRIAASADGTGLSTGPEIVETPQKFEDAISLIRELSEKITKGAKVDKAAVGIAGPLDEAKTKLVNAPNLPDYVGKPLKEHIEDILNCPVFLENDATLAGLGEAVFGSGKGHDIVAYLTISTGVGGARIVHQKIDQNCQGFEPGHQIIEIDGRECLGCKVRGHLEAYVSGPSIERKYGQKPEDIKDPRVWDEVAKYLSVGINNTIVLWSPDVIVLGGSVMKSLPVGPVEFYLKQSLKIFPKIPQVAVSSLKDSSGIFGGLAYLNQSN